MKIALLSCPNLLHDREAALLTVLRYLPLAYKAGCCCLFLPKDFMGKDEGEEDKSLPLLEKRASFYGLTLGFGYRKEGTDGYLVFSPKPRFIPFEKGASFQGNGRDWRILLEESEDPGTSFSLLFLSAKSLKSLKHKPFAQKDCFCFADLGGSVSCGVYRAGKLLCSLPEGQEALLVKEVLP